MRNSYVMRLSDGKVVLLPQIRDQLTLDRNSTLYGVAALDTGDRNSYIISAIPPQFWQNSFRLQVYVASPPGSLNKVAAVLFRSGINILTAWTAAISPNGEGCLTAIVQIPLDSADSAKPEADQIKEYEQYLLEKLLDEKTVLSESVLFRGPDPLSLVRLIKLRVLSKLGSLYAKGPSFRLQLDDATLDLENAVDSTGRRKSLFGQLDFQLGNQVLITPDTEERYFRLAKLPQWTFKRIQLGIKVKSAQEDFAGYYERALSVLAEENINIYSSNNTLVSKTRSLDGPAQEDFLEEARFSFLINYTLSPLNEPESRERLRMLMVKTLEDWAETRGAKIEIPAADWRIDDLWELSIPVFFATNAKPSIDPVSKSFALQVIWTLKKCGLYPVNVDISVARSLGEEIESLLEPCPLLISLYLPEEGLRLASSDEATGKNHYSPSDYTMYEEALARTMGKPILHLRYNLIFRPRYIGDQIDYAFDLHDEKSRQAILARFESALEMMLRSQDFLDSWNKCRKSERRLALRLADRDIESWLLSNGR